MNQPLMWKRNWKSYLLYTGVFTLSFLGPLLFRDTQWLANLFSIPILGSLFTLLIKIWRDDRNQEYSVELQNKQNDFILGTASHMAQIAYDKHVKFCEEYVDRIQNGFQELIREGPSEGALKIGGDLVQIRLKHATWLTKNIEEKLKPIEGALIEIGAKEGLLRRAPSSPSRARVVDEIYRLYETVMAFDKADKGNVEKGEKAVGITRDDIIEHIRNILGVNELTELRLKTTKIALDRLD